MTKRKPIDQPIDGCRKPTVERESEAQFQKAVIELAHRLGWRVAHFRTAQTGKGAWVTPVAADGAGFPDLVLVRDRVVFAELKSERGVISGAQREWQQALACASPQPEYHVWRPHDWTSIEAALIRRHLAEGAAA